LSDAGNAKIVADAMRHFEGERSILHAWVVMPNHVHALFSQVGETPLASLLHSWKGFSARQINQHTGNNGSIWQKSYFDRMVMAASSRHSNAITGSAGSLQ
jgi:REP element-mobilizing transposase RayT